MLVAPSQKDSKLHAQRFFGGRNLMLVTQHGKEQVLGPILERELGVTVDVATGINTDSFGTFTGEISRKFDQVTTVRNKVLAGLEATASSLGVASEGSFDADPVLPFVTSNLEVVMLKDLQASLEIIGRYRTHEVHHKAALAHSVAEVLTLAKSWDFPRHGVILSPIKQLRLGMQKELRTVSALQAAAGRYLSIPGIRSVYLQTDQRAHRNPTRMKAIAKAAEDLCNWIFSLCPRCFYPGFQLQKVVYGAVCQKCGTATRLPKAAILYCQRCHFSEESNLQQFSQTTDPQFCQFCNP